MFHAATWLSDNAWEHFGEVSEPEPESAGSGELFHTVIEIDHMNSSKQYCKALEGWAAGNGLGMRLLYKATATKRWEKIYVILCGPASGCQSFGASLRTECVDLAAVVHSAS